MTSWLRASRRSLAIFLAVLTSSCSASHALDDTGVPGTDAGGAPDAPGVLDSGAPADDGGAADDAGADAGAADDAPIAIDAGTTLAPGEMVCGPSTCDGATEGCLASCVDAAGVRVPACVALDASGALPASGCPGGSEVFPRFWLLCDSHDDCAPGEYCHLLYGSLGQYAQCSPCDAGCDLRFFAPLCDGAGDCPAAVPYCVPTPDLPGYSICAETP